MQNEQPAPMWEYRVSTTLLGDGQATKQLNIAATQGWEPIMSAVDGNKYTVTLRRPKPNLQD